MPGRLDVLHLDNHLLVVNKPAGLLVQEDATGDPDLLRLGKQFIKERFDKPGNVYLGLVHRLDRPASGVVVLARTSKAAARLSDQFRRRTPEKDYLAVVEGSCAGAGLRRDGLVKEEDGRVRVARSSESAGKSASLQWRSVAEKDGLTLLSVRLHTGRKHQIRVQVAAMGHPILGDFRYGAERELDGRNLALHCYRLAVIHPTNEEWTSFSAGPDWPGLFSAQIEALLASAR
ncbi:MAG: RNA pseudouridine synthase [Rhodothermales bacterium]